MSLVWLAQVTAVFLGIAMAAGVATSSVVAENARDTAGSSPYCVQVADHESDYKPARTLFDLSGLRMWAQRSGGMYMQHHAILIVGDEINPKLFYWSYHKWKFVPGVLNERTEGYGPALACTPAVNFVDGLPKVLPRSSDSDYEGYRYMVYADGQPNSGVNTTWISCGPPSQRFPKSCQHRFLNNGRHFNFSHRLEDLPDWQGMQNRLLRLFASFVEQAKSP